MFPIDPTPYVFGYAAVVFLLPWCILASYNLRQLAYAVRHSPLGLRRLLFTPEGKVEIETMVQNVPSLGSCRRKSQRWAKITAVCWILGFAVLGFSMFQLDKHDLLIDYSKGIYGENKGQGHNEIGP